MTRCTRGTERACHRRLRRACHDEGTYRCVVWTTLFDSGTKFESGSGWPSFYGATRRPMPSEEHSRPQHGMAPHRGRLPRVRRDLGHVFPDGPGPTGLRYCMNSASLRLDPRQREPESQK